MAIELIFINLFINIIPIVVILIPFIFIKKELMKKIYKRIFWGITIFFLVYYILPVIFQFGTPDTLNYGSQNILLGLGYILSRTFSLIINYFQLPLINFGFIFIIAPLISILFLKTQLRTEKGKFKDKLLELSFEVEKSPKDLIIERIKKSNWYEEKQLFKLLIVLLPISMYILTTILKIAGLEIANISDDKTALGWFIEVYFAYLAAFLFGIHLLKSSNAAFRGKFIGERLENQVYSSLITVGTPISILSIVLFLVEYLESFPLILYFFLYFIMAAFIFISYLVIFEPICIIILIKIVNSLKTHKESIIKIKESKIQIKSKLDYRLFIYPLLIGFASSLILLIIGAIGQSISNWVAGGNVQNIINETAFSYTQSFQSAFILEQIQIILNISLMLIIFVIAILIYNSFKIIKNLFINLTIFSFIFIILSFLLGYAIVLFGETIQWITGKLVSTDIFGTSINVYTLRTAFLNANFESKVLYYLAIPYQFSRYIFAIVFIAITIYYINQKFFTKTIKEQKQVIEITYSNINSLPTLNNFEIFNYLIISNPNITIPENERDEIRDIYNKGIDGIFYNELKKDDITENKRLYTTLRYMWNKNWIEFYTPEFAFSFERAELSALYVIYSDGRDVFSYKFKQEQTADPALVAGMFSAITSFIRETTSSTDYLRSIDHGDSKILIEYGNYVFAGLFANMETSEIRSKLKNFVKKFEEKHFKILENWTGITTPFDNDNELVKEIFL